MSYMPYKYLDYTKVSCGLALQAIANNIPIYYAKQIGLKLYTFKKIDYIRTSAQLVCSKLNQYSEALYVKSSNII